VATCALPMPTKARCPDPAVGIDLGLAKFLTTSDGHSVGAPHFSKVAERAIGRASRSVSRKSPGSRRRADAHARLARRHQHVANQRRDFHHKTARSLISRYGTIAHEAISASALLETWLPYRNTKAIHDAAWTQFLTILSHKAAEAGVEVIAVPRENTSRTCSQCGSVSDRPSHWARLPFICPRCGHQSDRDLNAAINILGLGLSLQASTQRVGAHVA
jgi:putative transposase